MAGLPPREARRRQRLVRRWDVLVTMLAHVSYSSKTLDAADSM